MTSNCSILYYNSHSHTESTESSSGKATYWYQTDPLQLIVARDLKISDTLTVKTLRKTCQISISKLDVSIKDIERFSGDKRHLGQYFH